ncbi:hypothetical protein B484DRAFT_58594 [Ochromonadaceae sp. CCMP2298]|nr:hypothetical protein B484DRAFT_58594 [Ochromonadaceae sp. CCMP2298]
MSYGNDWLPARPRVRDRPGRPHPPQQRVLPVRGGAHQRKLPSGHRGKGGKAGVDALAVCAGGTGARLYAISTFTFAGETQLPVLRSMNWSIGLLDTDDSSSPVEYVLCGHFRDALENQTVAEVNTLDNQRFSVTTDEFLDFFQKAPIALHWLSGTGHVLWANDTQLKNLGYGYVI